MSVNPGPSQLHSSRRVIASYGRYREAERTVDHLSDRGFPVEQTAIAAQGLRFVEQVTGRRTVARAAAEGAAGCGRRRPDRRSARPVRDRDRGSRPPRLRHGARADPGRRLGLRVPHGVRRPARLLVDRTDGGRPLRGSCRRAGGGRGALALGGGAATRLFALTRGEPGRQAQSLALGDHTCSTRGERPTSYLSSLDQQSERRRASHLPPPWLA